VTTTRPAACTAVTTKWADKSAPRQAKPSVSPWVRPTRGHHNHHHCQSVVVALSRRAQISGGGGLGTALCAGPGGIGGVAGTAIGGGAVGGVPGVVGVAVPGPGVLGQHRLDVGAQLGTDAEPARAQPVAARLVEMEELAAPPGLLGRFGAVRIQMGQQPQPDLTDVLGAGPTCQADQDVLDVAAVFIADV